MKGGNKRMSALMRDIDFNAYRAFKNVTNENTNHNERNPYNILKGGNNMMKFPFGLKEKRFRWQTIKNIAETTELTGNMVKRKDKFSTNGVWDNLINKTEENLDSSAINHRVSSTRQRKIKENLDSIRTLIPELNSSELENNKISKRIEKNIKKSQAIGSISNLLNSTPDIDHNAKPSKRYNIRTSSTDYSSHYRKLKVAVNIEQIRNNKEYAGRVTPTTSPGISRNVSIKNLSIAKQKKMDDLNSNIFTPLETQNLYVQKRGKHIDPTKFITRQDNEKGLARNKSDFGKRKFDYSAYQTKENIFPNSYLTTIQR